MNYQGIYINLDRRPDRRAEIEAELARAGLAGAYRRFRAMDGNELKLSNPHLREGEMGCYQSHMMVLRENIDQTQALHIIEDDVIFAGVAGHVIHGITERGLYSDCDIIYTDIWMPVSNAAYKAYKKLYDATIPPNSDGQSERKNFSIFDLKDIPFGSMSSYIVNPRSIRKLHDLFANEIAREPAQSIDLFVRDLSIKGTIKVGCVFPFVTSVRLDEIVETDIVRPYHNASALVAHVARYAFFVDADFNKCQASIDKHLPLPPKTDKITGVLNHVLAYSLTDGFESF